MELPVSVLLALETAINAWLKLDETALPRLATLQHKIIRLHITGLELNLYFFPGSDGIQVMGNYEGEADATIHSSVMNLLRLSAADNAGKVMLETDAYIEGDTGLGTAFSNILQDIDIDWEELLSHLVGDIVAHGAGNFVRESTGWLKESWDSMRMNLGEYVTEESRIMPPEAEVAHYLDQVDTLRMDTDRMEARIKRLKEKLAS
jgi:ubiquinone biosynthesis protein UbiJ